MGKPLPGCHTNMAPGVGRVHPVPAVPARASQGRLAPPTSSKVSTINYGKVTKTRGHFPTDQSALKLLRLAARNITNKRRRKPRHRHPRLENSPKPTRNPLPQPTKPNPLKTHEPRPSHRRFDKPATAALNGQATARPKTADGPIEAIRMLRLVRRSAVKARTQAINQLQRSGSNSSRPGQASTPGTVHPSSGQSLCCFPSWHNPYHHSVCQKDTPPSGPSIPGTHHRD